MSKIRDLHNQAMLLAQDAVVARHGGELERAELIAREAMSLEAEAADCIAIGTENEPTRSILYRSAASLALQAKEFDLAQRLIARGLSGYAPVEIESELKALYEQLNFERHLKTSDLEISDEEATLTVLGKAVMHGSVLADVFMKTLQTFMTLFDRTQARMNKSPYKPGAIKKQNRPLKLVLSEGRASSYSVTLKATTVIRGHEQLGLWSIKPADVFDQVIVGIDLINHSDDEGLKKQIADKTYYNNFRYLTRNLAPDGEKINFVGIATPRRSVGLTLPKNKIQIETTKTPDRDTEPVTVRGVLDYARSKRQDIIGLTDEEGTEHLIKVQEGMDDVVRSYFKQLVQVNGLRKGKYIIAEDIDGLDE